MKKFLLNFAGSFTLCCALIAFAYANTATRGGQPEIRHFLTPAEFPTFAAAVIGVSALMALIYTVISELVSKPK